MASIFDGIASTISDVLGDAIIITPLVGAAYSVVGIFREEPIFPEAGDGRTVAAVMPIISAPKDQLTALGVGDSVGPINGKTYRVISSITAGSPAVDGFVDIELELT